jgi:triosephosphate isomerase
MVQEDIDGCLVGRASVNVEEFVAIARFTKCP